MNLFLPNLPRQDARNIQFNSNQSNENKPATTLAPEKIHLKIHENSYSPEEKYKIINDCVQKCMQDHPQQPQSKKVNVFADGRDNCIQIQCRMYQRRR